MSNGNARSVLVVDDIEHEVKSILRYLQLAGWLSAYAASGEECLRLLEEGCRWDVIVLDAQLLPPQLSGFETLKEILRIRPEQCVVFLTGKDIFADQAMEAVHAGAVDYIQKPPKEMKEFVKRLERAIRQNQERLEAEREKALRWALPYLRAVSHQVVPRIEAAGLWAKLVEKAETFEEAKVNAREVQANLEQAGKLLRRTVYFRPEDYSNPDASTDIYACVRNGTYSIKALRHLKLGKNDPVRIKCLSVGKGLMVKTERAPIEIITEILVGNAAEAAYASRDAKQRSVTVYLEEEPESVLLRIHDTGAGIPKEVWDKLFTPGFTTKPGVGTGYGLYLVRSMVGKDNIWFDREATEGATVTCRFPKAENITDHYG